MQGAMEGGRYQTDTQQAYAQLQSCNPLTDTAAVR